MLWRVRLSFCLFLFDLYRGVVLKNWMFCVSVVCIVVIVLVFVMGVKRLLIGVYFSLVLLCVLMLGFSG